MYLRNRSLRQARCIITALLWTTVAAMTEAADLPAFPGAEGFGAFTPGGRGGRVLFVTNLNDSGPGSLREACEASGRRIVIFRVSGTITLQRAITVKNPFITIAGQSAPGDGICLRGATFGVATNDVVVRHIRSRLGDEQQQGADALDLFNGARNCIVDHCSATWSVDECLSTSGNNANCTIQWCVIGEALNQSKHAKGGHGYGSLARANGPMSWHHNLWIHNVARNPRLGTNYSKPPFPRFDVRNNVIYNYGGTATGLVEGEMTVNYVGNFIRRGPSSHPTRVPISTGGTSTMTFFIRDNVFEGNEELTRDNSRFFNVVENEGRRIVLISEHPFETAPVTTSPAHEALDAVLASVGASRPRRDAVDARLVSDVRNRTGRIIDSQAEVGGWPELRSTAAPVDGDKDGMPDAWERARGLNPGDPSDGNAVSRTGYTHIEDYLNELADSS